MLHTHESTGAVIMGQLGVSKHREQSVSSHPKKSEKFVFTKSPGLTLQWNSIRTAPFEVHESQSDVRIGKLVLQILDIIHLPFL
jgi:hypothetical protein